MEFAYYEKPWLDIVARQEEVLRGELLTDVQAMKLGGIMFDLAQNVYKRPAAFRIIMGGQVVFSFLMDGTSLNNEWWMDKKLNTCRVSGVSSIRTLMEAAEGLCPVEPEFENDGSFALCGGCFPYRSAETGKLLGWIEASGLAHEQDHQLIADALSQLLNIEAPRIVHS